MTKLIHTTAHEAAILAEATVYRVKIGVSPATKAMSLTDAREYAEKNTVSRGAMLYAEAGNRAGALFATYSPKFGWKESV